MKKVLTVILFMVVTLLTRAQDGKWVSDTIKGDELKGTVTTVAHCYIQEGMGMFIFWEDNNGRFAIVSPKKIFNSMISNGENGALSFVGLYDNDGNLKEKLEIWLKLEEKSGHKRLFAIDKFNNPLVKGHKKNIKKVLDAIRSGDGYVRILAGRYQADDFDLKIPPYK